MAGKHNFDAPIDLHQHELLNARLQALITLPANPFEGQICYSSHPDIKLGALWNGTEWTFFGLTLEELEGLQSLLSPPAVDRISQVGSISFVSPTELNAIDWKAIFSGIELDDTPLNITGITGTPSTYDRGDALYYKPDGTLGYAAGTEDSEGTPLPPAIPDGTLRMADILRKPTGENIIDLIAEQTSDFVSKSETEDQSIVSNLLLTKLTGGQSDYIRTDPTGKLQLVRGDKVGVRTTLQGTPGWARIITINCDFSLQLNYGMTLELSAVESNDFQTAKLSFYIRFNGSGDIQDSTCLLFGKVTPARYKIVKIDTETYELWFQHYTSLTLYAWRPLFSFGTIDKYTLYNREEIDDLPAGDQLDFTELSINHNDLNNIQGGITTERYHLDEDQWDAAEGAEGPTGLNPFVTVSKLNSYAYVQEAPINGNHYARKDGVWTAFTPFVVAGTATDGYVVQSVSGVPTWVAPSGGGSSLWTDNSTYISRDGKVVIGASTQYSSSIETLEIKTRRAESLSDKPQIRISTLEDDPILEIGSVSTANYPSWGKPGFSIGLAATGGNAKTFVHRSGYTAAYAGDAFRFENASGEEIFAGTHTKYVRMLNPSLSIGTSVVGNNLLRHRSGVSNNGGIQFLIEDSNAVSNFQVDNIGRAKTRNYIWISGGGFGVNMTPNTTGMNLKGTNDGSDTFRLYTQTDVLVTFYRRTLGWVFRAFGTNDNQVIMNLQDVAGTERFKFLGNGRAFFYSIPITVPTAGTNELYVDGSGFLKLAI